ncbi:MAG TPA: ATP synthase subunit C [Hyphomicrobiales bacterium]|nr:ATP synthase subunit C [Kaistiaceae bacterium]HQF31653.1 ATP synthase subunit C [Hyphomicrobiales bacterium]
MTGRPFLLVLLAGAGLVAIALSGLLLIANFALAETPATAAGALDPAIFQWAALGAAISSGLATLAAGYAVAMVGSAAVGALAEKPELLGRVLVMVGLAEGIAIYGLIVAILILNRAG